MVESHDRERIAVKTHMLSPRTFVLALKSVQSMPAQMLTSVRTFTAACASPKSNAKRNAIDQYQIAAARS
jgi:hypothetical protein